MVTLSSASGPATQSAIAGWLTPDEFAILEAICDTLLPSLEPPAGSSEVLAAYYRRCARELHVAQQIAEKLGQQSRRCRQIFVSSKIVHSPAHQSVAGRKRTSFSRSHTGAARTLPARAR